MGEVTRLGQQRPVIENTPNSTAQGPRQRNGRQKNRLKWLWIGIVAVGALTLISAGSAFRDRCEPSPIEIFEGITYGCKRVGATGEGSGLVHWVIVDLAAPGIELYVTPLDPNAVARGWQYRLRRIGDVVDKDRLAVA